MISVKDIGELREQVTLIEYTTSQATNGEEVISWSDLETVWAKVEFKTAGSDESLIADRKTSEIAAEIAIQERTDINEKNRLRYNGEEYEIVSVLNTQKRFFQILEVKKLDGDQA